MRPGRRTRGRTVRIAGGIRCSTNRALVMMPSQPSFWTPGRPARNLSVTSLPRPDLAERRARDRSVSLRFAACVPSASSQSSSKVATGASWILPRLWSSRVTSSHSASGVTIRHDTRLSTAVPHSTAFLPPAFIATLPPMHDASAEVGIDGEHEPRRFGRVHRALRDHARAAVDRRDRRARPGRSERARPPRAARASRC